MTGHVVQQFAEQGVHKASGMITDVRLYEVENIRGKQLEVTIFANAANFDESIGEILSDFGREGTVDCNSLLL